MQWLGGHLYSISQMSVVIIVPQGMEKHASQVQEI